MDRLHLTAALCLALGAGLTVASCDGGEPDQQELTSDQATGPTAERPERRRGKAKARGERPARRDRPEVVPTANAAPQPISGGGGVAQPLPSTSPPGQLALGVMVHLEGWKAKERNAFDRNAEIVRKYASIFEAHGARLTLEAKEPIDTIPLYGDNFLAELEGRGHAIGVHADLGFSRRREVRYEDFVRDLTEMRVNAQRLGVEIRHVSGICSAEDWVTAAIEAGFLFASGDVGFCYASMPESKRPSRFRNCASPFECHDPAKPEVGERLHPWRARDGKTWIDHDPGGKLVILPSSYPIGCYAEATQGGESAHCDFASDDIAAFEKELQEAIALAEAGKVNQYYVAWSLGRPLDEGLLEQWLTMVDGYVASGKVAWKTLPEMYDMYVASE
jgi:hypothetical protein